MLRLGAVDVHGVRVGDGDHEHGGVRGGLLTPVVLATAATATAVTTAVAVAVAGRSHGSDGLEVAEDGVVLGLAGLVGGRGRDGVVLCHEVEGNHVSGLGGHGLRGESELVVGADSHHHSGSGNGQALGQGHAEESVEKHVCDC